MRSRRIQFLKIKIFFANFLVIFGFGLLIFAPILNAQAATVRELQQQKQALDKKIKENEKKQEQKKKEAEDLAKAIKAVEDDIKLTEVKINDTQGNIDQTQGNIEQTSGQINEKQEELNREIENQNEALRTIYEIGDQNVLETLVGSDSLSDFIKQNDYFEALESKIEATIAEITFLKSELEAKKAELEKKKDDLGKLKNQQEIYKRGLDQQKNTKNKLLTDNKAVQKSLEAQIDEAKKMYADVNSELYKLQEAARKAAQAKLGKPKPPKGSSPIPIIWPVDYRYISTDFGGRTPFQDFHTGLDLVNITGTPVVAAADGVISSIGTPSYGYGNHVIISHNERFSTLYGHFSEFADIAVGMNVKQGDIIGYVGSTGWSTGPHMHFEVREYGVPMDPLDYLP